MIPQKQGLKYKKSEKANNGKFLYFVHILERKERNMNVYEIRLCFICVNVFLI